MSKKAKAVLEVEKLDVVADRGYFDSEEILVCDRAGITVTLPKPMTSRSKAQGCFGKQDFRYLADEDVYICPTEQRLTYRYTNEENGLSRHHYWTNVCQACPIKALCTTGKERRISRWVHEHDRKCPDVTAEFLYRPKLFPKFSPYERPPWGWSMSSPVGRHGGRSVDFSA